ncbi:MAG: PAS-domain containing protein, partial [Pseudorhodobacter sp.]|nr:PAS-domain containing protein [Pseudorhodobacter sp.]
MEIVDRLARERRARLAAERLLEQKSRELFAANEKLALHARSLSDQIVEQRLVVRSALSEAETLKGQNSRFMTDLEHAHTAAVVAERRLWDSINTIRDGFAVFNADQKLIAANRAYLGAFDGHPVALGISYAEILRLSGETGLIDIGARSVDEWCRDMLARWNDDPIEPLVVQFANGAWVRLVDHRSRDGDMVSLALNITEQMRIWAGIEAIPDGFVLFDREDRLMTCNQRYRDLYPESTAAMVPGASYESILRYGLEHGAYADATGVEDAWIAERMARRKNKSDVFEQEMADGRWLRVIEHETPDGGRVGLRVDITAAKQQQAALETARLAAEAANRAKSAFLANMSHEIRTPLNGILGFAELLADTPLNFEQSDFVQTLKSCGESLLVLINDILDFSKLEAGKLMLETRPFDLRQVIHEVVS